MTDNRKVLLVDDEPNVLQGYKRHLRKLVELECALSGAEGLQLINEANKVRPFAVVVSDMKMPGMSGVEFLERVRSLCPDTIRVMLTGNADQETASEAVNRGNIFRFLNKPCDPERLAETIELGVAHYKLHVQETAMLSKTVAGCISLMTDVMSIVNPESFGRLANQRRIAKAVAQQLGVDRSWEVEIAAMLSPIGLITVPREVVEKERSCSLSPAEQAIFEDHPRVGASLIRRIPRLEFVAEAVQHQLTRYDAANGEHVPTIAARILKATQDIDRLCAFGLSEKQAVAKMQEDAEAYDPDVLAAVVALTATKQSTIDVPIGLLEDGMILEEHVRTHGGNVLVAAGQIVNPSLRARLSQFSAGGDSVREPIRVRKPS